MKQINALNENEHGQKKVFYQVDLATNYFVKNINHLQFGFMNLEAESDINDYRDKTESYTIMIENLREIVSAALLKYPDDLLVAEAAGNYFSDILSRYYGSGGYSEMELYDLIIEQYERCLSGGREAEHIYAGLGYIYLMHLSKQSVEKGAAAYRKALEYNAQSGPYNYYLAQSLYILLQFEEALSYSERAIEYYENDSYKAYVYMVNGDIHRELEQYENAKTSYENAIAINSKPVLLWQRLIETLISLEDIDQAEKEAVSFINTNRTNINNIILIINIFSQKNYDNSPLSILDTLISECPETDTMGQAHLLYSRGIILWGVDNPRAETDLKNAQELLRPLLPKNHYLLNEIKDALSSIEAGN